VLRLIRSFSFQENEGEESDVSQKANTGILTLSVLLPVLLAEDVPFARPRPLLALLGPLQDGYGLLVTYEDAPADHDDLDAEVRSNGRVDRYPKWTSIIFHISSELPSRPDNRVPTSADPA
jgi:hypothetical protein